MKKYVSTTISSHCLFCFSNLSCNIFIRTCIKLSQIEFTLCAHPQIFIDNEAVWTILYGVVLFDVDFILKVLCESNFYKKINWKVSDLFLRKKHSDILSEIQMENLLVTLLAGVKMRIIMVDRDF